MCNRTSDTVVHMLLTIQITRRHHKGALLKQTALQNILLCLCPSLAAVFPECSACAVSSCSVTLCQGPRVAVSRCCSVPSSSTADSSGVQGRHWMFAKLSLLLGSKSVWAVGQTDESPASPAPAGSATFTPVQSSTGQINLSLLNAFWKNQGKMTYG